MKYRDTIKFFAFLLFALILFAKQVSQESITGVVSKVVDGDTIHLKTADEVIKVRLNCIDAPEKKQRFGQEATEALKEWVLGQVVKVEALGTDRYKRKIGVVYRDDQEINLIMVKSGLAWNYKEYCDDERYAKAQEIARKARLGLWRDRKPIYPSDYRHKK
ncbi:MAG: thermonuclease family protein [Helicobacteraceae bacterium]|nr:thermonuclease family protein [Helicobacteraceae bacterium]